MNGSIRSVGAVRRSGDRGVPHPLHMLMRLSTHIRMYMRTHTHTRTHTHARTHTHTRTHVRCREIEEFRILVAHNESGAVRWNHEEFGVEYETLRPYDGPRPYPGVPKSAQEYLGVPWSTLECPRVPWSTV